MLIFFDVLTYIDIAYFFFVAVYLLLHRQQLKTPLQVFSLFFGAVFIIALAQFILSVAAIRNTALFPIFLFMQMAWLTIYYYQLFKGSIMARIVLLSAIACTIGFIIEYQRQWHQIKEQLGGLLYFISNLLFVGYSLLFFIATISGNQKPKYTLINTGILLYFSGSSAIFLFGDYLSKIDLESQVIVWIFNVLLHIVFLILIHTEVWKTLHKDKRATLLA